MKQRKLTHLFTVFLIAIMTITMIAGCQKKQEPTTSVETETEDDTSTSVNTKNTAKNKKQPEIAVTFANALCDEDYSAILDMLYLPENSVVSPDNIEEFLKRSNLADFIGSDSVEIIDCKQTDTAIVTIMKSYQNECEIDFVLNSDGNFVLQMENAYAEREVIAPGKTNIKINGITLDEQKYATKYKDDTTGLVVYKLICPVTDFDAHISTSIDDYDVHVTWNQEEKPYSILNYDIDETTMASVCEATKDVVNNLVADLHAGKTNASELQNYFSVNTEPKTITNIVEWYKKLDSTNPSTITILEPSDKEEDQSYICSDTNIKLCLRYKNTWSENETEKNSHGYVDFVMSLENGTYKILETSIDKKPGTFFTNSFKHEWNE